MTKKKHFHLGVGAIVSFQSKFIHPHDLRDDHFPDRPKGHRLVDAVVVRRELKMINHVETKCVVVHHEDFKDDNDEYQEIWCSEEHIKVQKEGNPEGFFDQFDPKKEDETGKETEEEDVEMQMKVGKRASVDPSGFDDPLRPREGRDLMWRNINMTLEGKSDNKNKKLLDSVWGDVPKKQVTAIMGPSGSGKTSLLNILAGRVASNGNIKISYDIRLNNYSVNPTRMEVRNKIAFVAQDDSLQITATPREAIRFSAKLRLPGTMTDEALDNLTDCMLDELGLTQCADVLVGGALLKGISGGERKRTSVGVELVTQPALVFLDEPTSGLDSHNALQLCQLLKKVANAGSSVLFTIHQPSSEIFTSFDSLILLNEGRVMYQGLIPDVPGDFGHKGYKCPKHYNPADHIMHVAVKNSVQMLEDAGFFPKDTRNIAEPFESNETDNKDPLGITRSGRDVDQAPTPGLASQTQALFAREVRNLYRNTHALKARTAMTLVISLVIGCLFWQVADLDFSQFINAQSTFASLLMALMANVFATTLPSLVAFPEERPVFLREYSTNHYSVISYFASRLTMELIVNGVQVTVSTFLTYFMVGFHIEYWVLWTASYLLACASSALGVMVGSATESATTAIELLPAVFMPQILFSGFFIPPELIPDWLAWITYICPLTYGVRILLAGEFGGDRCAGIPPPQNSCDKILQNAGADEDDVWWYYLVLLVLFVVFRFLGLFILKKKASKFY
mmetsp:Transcript_32322/g.54079  ORF Transcript_32322/g.54079 Transcript_32322/m.54079 type:complete len:736 (-) Transcript_32322:15-2222(-)|eukprot:CAMPEP_0178750758 /NCGR_PEP_ID=MMETSP0744-20121128/10170_1 /TAXON_ID=913974 /ORGANISM="Nitzschia punctata, Strain CCMP561" /LENGTH=735 /DNA_ID=CAMNT_0020404371 /DNA_START=204 /DNA_END=2411 /DNA_ORIENTATION=-